MRVLGLLALLVAPVLAGCLSSPGELMPTPEADAPAHPAPWEVRLHRLGAQWPEVETLPEFMRTNATAIHVLGTFRLNVSPASEVALRHVSLDLVTASGRTPLAYAMGGQPRWRSYMINHPASERWSVGFLWARPLETMAEAAPELVGPRELRFANATWNVMGVVGAPTLAWRAEVLVDGTPTGTLDSLTRLPPRNPPGGPYWATLRDGMLWLGRQPQPGGGDLRAPGGRFAWAVDDGPFLAFGATARTPWPFPDRDARPPIDVYVHDGFYPIVHAAAWTN